MLCLFKLQTPGQLLKHPALAAKGLFPDGTKRGSEFITVSVDRLGVKIAILHENHIDDEIISFSVPAREKEMHAKLPVSDRSSRRSVRVFSQSDVHTTKNPPGIFRADTDPVENAWWET